MPLGFSNSTNLSIDNINYVANSTDYAELLVKSNEIVFDGTGFFILLTTLLVILFLIFQQTYEDEFLINIMVSSTIVTFASFFFRAAEVSVYGVQKGLLTDKLLWVFPLIMIFSAAILYLTKD